MLDNPLYVDSLIKKYPEQWNKFLKKLKLENKELDYNPFTEKVEVMRTEFEPEKSLSDKARSRVVSLGRSKNAVYDYARSNVWSYFLTFTLSPEVVDRYDFNACKKKLQKWLDNFKQRKCPSFEYLIVPEQHKDGAWHFHGLSFGLPDNMLVDSGHFDKKGNIIYNFPAYNLGFSTATKIQDTKRASSYIIKYIEKTIDSIASGKRYFVSHGVKKPDVKTYTMTDEEKMLLYESLGECSHEKTVVGPEFKVHYKHFNT